MTLNVHIYPSPILNESRIMRETTSIALAALTDQVIISGTAREDLPRHEQLDARRQIVRVGLSRSGHRQSFVVRVVSAAIWSIALLNRFRSQPIAIVNAHSVAVLPVCALLAQLTGAKLIYDTHELETETVGAKGIQQQLFRLIEASLIRRCDAVFVVNRSIADWYRNKYPGVHPVTIRNIPRNARNESRSMSPRDRFRVPERSRLYVHAGNIGPGRNIESILRAFRSDLLDDHVLFLGDGPLLPTVQQAAKDSRRVHWLPPVAPDQVVEALRECTIGLCLIEPSCLSYRLSLPNKALEYIAAGLPFLHTAMPEVSRLLTGDDARVWQVSDTASDLEATASTLTEIEVTQMRERISRIELPDWDDEAEAMVSVYRRLMGML